MEFTGLDLLSMDCNRAHNYIEKKCINDCNENLFRGYIWSIASLQSEKDVL